ncbi:MAG: biotin transporter BioY [Planctomycetota bacterium]
MKNGGDGHGLPRREITDSRFPLSPAALGVDGAAVLKVAVAVLATALAAQVKVPALGSPVPITLQTLAVLLTGFALGAHLAPAAMLAYLVLGAFGLPLFAVGGFGPTGGYIVGFVFAAAFVGNFGQGGRGSWPRTAAVAAAGTGIIFATGLIWLTAWLHGDGLAAWRIGGLPFWPGELLKTAVAVAAVQAWRRSGGGFRGG